MVKSIDELLKENEKLKAQVVTLLNTSNDLRVQLKAQEKANIIEQDKINTKTFFWVNTNNAQHRELLRDFVKEKIYPFYSQENLYSQD